MKKNKLTFLLIFVITMYSCSNKKDSESLQNESSEKKNESSLLFQGNTNEFYSIEPQIDEIESEIAILKDKVLQYESQISAPTFNTEILKLIKTPKIKHEIELSNGTTIQGTIIYENADEMIVETQIGQLKINKNEILQIEDVLPPIAVIEFIGDGIEEIYKDYRGYKGTIKNMGLKRADFVRIIYSMYDENSNLIVSDSAFVDGQKYQYNSGIISDASVNQNSFADYYVTVNIPTDKIVKYHLKEVRWEYYE